MTPTEIKIQLMRNELSQADVARACKVSRGHVYRVIEGRAISHHVQTVIAHAIASTPEEVFPERYAPKRNIAKIRDLERVSAKVRKVV